MGSGAGLVLGSALVFWAAVVVLTSGSSNGRFLDAVGVDVGVGVGVGVGAASAAMRVRGAEILG
jgi:hypothetical protein